MEEQRNWPADLQALADERGRLEHELTTLTNQADVLRLRSRITDARVSFARLLDSYVREHLNELYKQGSE